MNASCPVDGTTVDSNAARVIALLVVTAVALFLATGSPLWVIALVPDFAMRAAGRPRLSPLARVASALLRTLGVLPRPTSAPPKRFAAAIGVAFTAVAGALALTGAPVAASVVAAVLLACALLEGVAGYCIGCQVHALLTRARALVHAA